MWTEPSSIIGVRHSVRSPASSTELPIRPVRRGGSGRSGGISNQVHMSAYLEGDCSFIEQRRHRVRQFFPLLGRPVPSQDAELDVLFAEHYLRYYEAGWRAFPDVVEGMDLLEDLAAPTSDRCDDQRRLRTATGETRPVRSTGEGRKCADPQRARLRQNLLQQRFRTACRFLGLTPERTVYVGDWLRGDAMLSTTPGSSGSGSTVACILTVDYPRRPRIPTAYPCTGSPLSPNCPTVVALGRI